MIKIAKKIRSFVARSFNRKASFSNLAKQKYLCLYAGDVPSGARYNKFIGVSLRQSDHRHIKHDVLEPLPLRDGCVDVFQSEDVFEHIDPKRLPAVIDEIYRVLKPGGILRISMPDYRCDLLFDRTRKDNQGNLTFDPGGGGDFVNGEVVNGGHVWFPVYESVKKIIDKTQFLDVTFYHYYDETGGPVTKSIDYSIGYVKRTPDHDSRVQNPRRPLSIVLDCKKVKAG